MTTPTPTRAIFQTHPLLLATGGRMLSERTVFYTLSALLETESTERRRLARELETARQVQERLFPVVSPAVAGLEHCGLWRAAHKVSGDYLDYFDVPGGNLGVAIGDVAGKGLPAALLMSTLHGMVRALGLARTGNLEKVVRRVNQLFFRVSPDSCFASLFLARYDHEQQRLYYVNAGHESPLLLRRVEAGWRIVPLEPSGPVIGMLPGHSYRERTIALLPDDILVAYTDGLPETRNPKGEEWGGAGLLHIVEECGEDSVEAIAARIFEEADRFADETPQHDDMTLWVARVRPTKRRATLGLEEAMLEMAEASAA